MAKAVSDATVEVVPIGFPSKGGTATIRGVVWMPAQGSAAADVPRRGIVQLVHGMAEYIDRYDEFARYLVGEGFVVAGHDHLGHGRSVNDKAEWGDLPAKTGKDVMVEDTHTMRTRVQERFGAALPYVLFGHSMGSFVVRAYLARHAEGLAGAIACGTGHQPMGKSKAGNGFATFLARVKGNDHRSQMMQGMADGAYAKAIPNARTPFDWLNTDAARVDEYIADEACGYMFSVGGYATLTSLTADNADPQMAARVPADLPLFFIAGAQDPVGDYGKGVSMAVAMLQNAGKNVEIKLYEGMRHEILNEPNRAMVYADVVAWIEENCL